MTAASPRIERRRASRKEWELALAGCPWATFFQTPDWYEATAPLLPEHRLEVEAWTVGDRQVVWPFLAKSEGRLVRRTTERRGNAAGVYGGWVAPAALSVDAASALAEAWSREAKVRLRLNPFHPLPDTPWATRTEDHTHVVDLARGMATVEAGYASGFRRDLRKAEAASVLVRRGSGPADVTTYLALYARTLARWGDAASSRYPDAVLADLAQRPGARLWIADDGGRPAAAILAFDQGGHRVLWHSANDPGEVRHSPFKLLIHRILEESAREGFAMVDLNPSGRDPGSAQWKDLLGARPLPSPVLQGAGAPGSRP